jgi:hypothetical protein
VGIYRKIQGSSVLPGTVYVHIKLSIKVIYSLEKIYNNQYISNIDIFSTECLIISLIMHKWKLYEGEKPAPAALRNLFILLLTVSRNLLVMALTAFRIIGTINKDSQRSSYTTNFLMS